MIKQSLWFFSLLYRAFGVEPPERATENIPSFPIDCLAKVTSVKKIDKSFLFSFFIKSKDRKHLIEKASIAINGISLTISSKTKVGFQVWVIPHTIKLTNLSKLKKNDLVNIEIDILSKYVRNYFNEKKKF